MVLTYAEVVELVLEGQCSGVNTINVFHYGVVSGGGAEAITLEAAATAFATSVVSPLTLLLTEEATFSAVRARMFYDPVLEHIENIGEQGTSESDTLPPFCTLGFIYRRSNLLTRNGYKRFSGIPEEQQSSGHVSPAYAATCATFAAALADDLLGVVGEDIVIFTPVIVSKVSGGAAIVPPANYPISTVQFQGIGTQNSRKS